MNGDDETSSPSLTRDVCSPRFDSQHKNVIYAISEWEVKHQQQLLKDYLYILMCNNKSNKTINAFMINVMLRIIIKVTSCVVRWRFRAQVNGHLDVKSIKHISVSQKRL